jgi:hypothetical protein
LEDYGEDVLFGNEVLRLQMQRLNSQLKFCDDSKRMQWIADVVVDMVLSASLVPTAMVYVPGKHDVHLHFDYLGDVTRFWIQGVPVDLIEEMVKELRLSCAAESGLEHSILLCDFEPAAYVEMDVAQRLAHLSLSNFYGPLRKWVKKSGFVNKVCASPQLGQWMLACSNMDEQYWLNTCEVAARNDMMAIRVPTVAHCVEYTRHICRHMNEVIVPKLSKVKPWTSSLGAYCCLKMPSVHAYATRTLDGVEAELQELERRGELLLEMGEQISQEKLKIGLQQLVLDWNKITQSLSTIYYPDEPVVLSQKLFSNNWQLSAKTIALPCILSSLLPWQPFVMNRNEGTQGEYFRSASWFTWRDKLSLMQYPEFENLAVKMKIMSAADKTACLNQLWKLAFSYGGLFFASNEQIFGSLVGHLNGLFGIRLPKAGKHFLVCDPEITRFKFLTFEQMSELIVNPKVNFDLFNV